RDDLGRRGRLALARQARGNAEAGEPDLAGRRVHQDMSRLDIFVDQAPSVEPTQRTCQANGDPQKLGHFPWVAQESRQELATGVFKQERGPSLMLHQRERPRRPGRVQLVAKQILMFEALETL